MTSNLLSNLKLWTMNADEIYPTVVIYLDFQKASDKAFSKVETLSWIRDYLSDRTYQVRIEDTITKVHKVLSEVPQGSVLGPLLFIIYVSDLAENMLCMYAVDTKLFCDPTIHHGTLTEDLAEL